MASRAIASRLRAKVLLGLAALSVLMCASAAHASCPAPDWNQIVVYSDANEGGACKVLGVGQYNAPFGGVNNDWMSSITVGVGVVATLYRDGNFGGRTYTYTNGPFTYNLAGWANDDVSSLKVAYRYDPIRGNLPLAFTLPAEESRLFDFSAAATEYATSATTPTFDLGTLKAGTTIRLGTCSGGGDLSAASASGDTLLRVFLNGVEQTDADDDGCPGTRASYLSYTLPSTGSVTFKAGCYASGSCSGSVHVKWGLPDSNGAIADVRNALNVMTGDSGRRNKLNFWQAGRVLGAYTRNLFDKHFQGMVRVPKTLASSPDANPRFILAGSDNADLYTVQLIANPTSALGYGLVGPLPEIPDANSQVIAQASNGAKYLHLAKQGLLGSALNAHLGGLQASGRWLAGGIEAGGGPGPSTIRFWDLAVLPNPILVKELDNTTSSASAIALTKMPGKNQPFVMLVGGLNGGRTAQVWTLTGDYGYANLMSGTWQLRGLIDVSDFNTDDQGFQAMNFVSQTNGELFLVGMVGAHTDDTEGGADTAMLFKVNHDDWSTPSLQLLGSKIYTCQFDNSRNCAFNSASNIFVDTDRSVLRLYGSKGWRPEDSNAFMTFVEFY